MNEIDLHGLPHLKAIQISEDFVLLESNKNSFKCRIITGNSHRLQNRIFKMLDQYKFKYYIPSKNLGEIIVTD